MSMAPTILKPGRAASCLTMAEPIGPRPKGTTRTFGMTANYTRPGNGGATAAPILIASPHASPDPDRDRSAGRRAGRRGHERATRAGRDYAAPVSEERQLHDCSDIGSGHPNDYRLGDDYLAQHHDEA